MLFEGVNQECEIIIHSDNVENTDHKAECRLKRSVRHYWSSRAEVEAWTR